MFDTPAIKQDFSRAAAGYDAAAGVQRQVRARAVRVAAPYWTGKMHILDAGCGTGALAKEISQDYGWQITGLDLAPGMCLKSGAVNADAAAMPFADAAFDGVFSSLMLQWANDPLPVLREMVRVLKPGGQLVLATLTEGTLHELRQSFEAVGETPPVTAFLPASDILLRVAHAGLSVFEKQEYALTEHYPDVRGLMRGLKAIGASDKRTGRRRGLMTPYRLRRIERAYAPGVPATWNVLALVAGKP